MKSTIGAIALVGGVIATTAAIALAGSTAFAETTAYDQSKRLAKLWSQDTAAASQTADTRKNFTGISSSRRHETTGAWARKFPPGRAHDPNGR